MKRNKGLSPILILIVVAVAGVIAFVFWKKPYSGNQQIATPVPSPTPISTESTAPQITTPTANSKVVSPFTVKGTIPSSWLFEGQLPIKLLDANRTEIASGTGYETVPGSWTGEAPVSFEGTIEFTTSAKSGFLVIGADNPSGLPENAKSFEIPVKF